MALWGSEFTGAIGGITNKLEKSDFGKWMKSNNLYNQYVNNPGYGAPDYGYVASAIQKEITDLYNTYRTQAEKEKKQAVTTGQTLYQRKISEYNQPVQEYLQGQFGNLREEWRSSGTDVNWGTWLNTKADLKERFYSQSPYQRGERQTVYSPLLRRIHY